MPVPDPPLFSPAASGNDAVFAFTPAPQPPAGTGGYAPVPGVSVPPPVAYGQNPIVPPLSSPASSASYAPVPGVSVPPPMAYGQSPAISPLPSPLASSGGYAPVPGVSGPPPMAYGQSPAISPLPSPLASSGGYAAVPGGSAPTPAAYGQSAAPYSPSAAPAYNPAQGISSGTAYPTAQKSNTLLKVIVAFVVVLFVGGALAVAGLWYAAQKIKAKAHEATVKVLGANPSAAGGLAGLLSGAATSDESIGGFKGDPCRFLSRDEVSRAVGVTVIRTEVQDAGCNYIAKGDPADVTAKHTSALMGEMGVDAKSQQMAQKVAGAFFAQQEAGDKDLSAQAAKGEITVLNVFFTSGNAALEMKMNRGAYGNVRGGAPFGRGDAALAKRDTGDLTGIGDDAIVAAGSMILVRKGKVVAHFMFASCPCSTSAITPLARTVAGRL